MQDVLKSIFSTVERFGIWIVGGVWGVLSPTIPFAAICLFAIVLDCFSAWRLARRVKMAYPNSNDGKFKSRYASKMFSTVMVIYSCIVLAYLIDAHICTFAELYLPNFIAGGFCLVQLWSILENESSENDSTWARVLQKVLVNKAARHFDMDPGEIEVALKGKKKRTVTKKNKDEVE